MWPIDNFAWYYQILIFWFVIWAPMGITTIILCMRKERDILVKDFLYITLFGFIGGLIWLPIAFVLWLDDINFLKKVVIKKCTKKEVWNELTKK